MSKIVNRVSLREFRKDFDALKLAPMVNKETGEPFMSLVFIKRTEKDGKVVEDKTFVGFSSKMGALTPSEIKENVSFLQVVTLESGSHKLCRKGEDTWEDVDL